MLVVLVVIFVQSASDIVIVTCDYIADSFLELNAWYVAVADASSDGMVDGGFDNLIELTIIQLDNLIEFAEKNTYTELYIA